MTSKNPLRILGIDPGLASVGYGCVELSGNRFSPVEYGVIRTGPELGLAARLLLIHEGCAELFARLAPDTIALEELFFGKNQTTGMVVSQARGVIVLALAEFGLELYEYTPLVVKRTVTGDGRADKLAIQTMTQKILGLKNLPKPDDAADGLAIAICHAQHLPLLKRLNGERPKTRKYSNKE